jgi:ABC-type glycerol-3-phosphate transport system permease component
VSGSRRWRKRALLGLAALITFLNVAPMIWIALSGFKTRLEIFTLPPVWIPSRLFLGNFQRVLDQNLPFLLNSAIVTALTTAGVLLFAVPAAYALAVFGFRRKGDLEMWILSTRMMPPIAAAVPLFLAARGLNLFDTLPGLIIVYVGFNLSFAVWLATSFFRSMPMEILEAARVDGASWLQILLRIAVPLNRSGIATVSVFTAIFSWNELLVPLFLTSNSAKTFTIVLTEFQGQTNTVWEQMAAGAAIQVVPIVILTFLVQRSIVAGVTLGAVK